MMQTEDIRIVTVTEQNKAAWDDFVENRSVNGTFLQTWRFLDYHPAGRFEVHSLIAYYKDRIVAVCPGCVRTENGRKRFLSHGGTSYGGPILSGEICKAEKLLVLIGAIERHLREAGFDEVCLKPTMRLLCENNTDELLAFALSYAGYQEYKDLNLYIDYVDFTDDLMAPIATNRKQVIRKCMEAGCVFRPITQREEIEQLHEILAENLNKYGKTPVHTVDEWMDIRMNRLNDREICFDGVFLDEKMVAGSLCFEFEKQNCVHTQNLAADPEYNKLSPMSFLYYKLIEKYRDKGFRHLSWGITTEHMGENLNPGLTFTKESFGSRYCLVRTFLKERL